MLFAHDLLSGSWPLPAALPPGPLLQAVQRLHAEAVACGDRLGSCHGLAVLDVALRCRRRLLDLVQHVRNVLGDTPNADVHELLDTVTDIAITLPRLGRAALHRSPRPPARATSLHRGGRSAAAQKET